MVDPKRHINILSEEDQLFLNECEEEFGDRFSEHDAEFTAYCAQPARAPPVLEPWQSRNFQGGGGGGGRYNHHNRNWDYRDRPYQQRGGRYNNNNNRGGRDNNRYNSVGRNYS
ncbi:RNMT-activating mini protein [Aedes aegypti]|uniref:Uncharacterized protein n=1 Tax=Aedes aegypti TaxID=7159 RepID=A0A6I8TWW8_AEDAE|nr:RNMT-activating mini protein [Aedes aegypti]